MLAREFQDRPSSWILERFHGGGSLSDLDYALMADKLRPFYLDYLGRQRLNGSSVSSTWRKERAVQTTFGGKQASKRFQEWKRRARSISTQRDYDMQLAIAYELDPEIMVSDADMLAIQRGMLHPEYEELRLRHWDQIPTWMHWEWELARATDMLPDGKGKLTHAQQDPYYVWVESIRNHPDLPTILRQIAQMRVRQRRGTPASLPQGIPAKAHAAALSDYRVPPDWTLHPGERVTNPTPGLYARGLQARRQVRQRQRHAGWRRRRVLR